MDILVLVLTSREAHLALRSVQSVVLARRLAKCRYEIRVVVNSLTDGYFDEVSRLFQDYRDVVVVSTPSNGYSGKGHNSVLDIFRSSPEFDFMIMIDGDDLLYPTGLKLIEESILQQPDIDMLGLQTNDSIRLDNSIYTRFPLLHYARMYSMFDNWENWWQQFTYDDPLKRPLGSFLVVTPARFVLFSRKVVDARLNPRIEYSERTRGYDDLLPFVTALYHSRQGSLNIYCTSSNYVYLYTALTKTNETIVAENEYADKIFREEVASRNLPSNVWDELPRVPHVKLTKPVSFSSDEKVYFCNEYLDSLVSDMAHLDWERSPWDVEAEHYQTYMRVHKPGSGSGSTGEIGSLNGNAKAGVTPKLLVPENTGLSLYLLGISEK